MSEPAKSKYLQQLQRKAGAVGEKTRGLFQGRNTLRPGDRVTLIFTKTDEVELQVAVKLMRSLVRDYFVTDKRDWAKVFSIPWPKWDKKLFTEMQRKESPTIATAELKQITGEDYSDKDVTRINTVFKNIAIRDICLKVDYADGGWDGAKIQLVKVIEFS